MNCFGYIRVSGLTQVDKDGPQRQRETIETFCVTHGLTLLDVFFEAGVSGTKETLDRPAFQKMLGTIEECRSNGVEIHGIVSENMDRIARDLMVSELLLNECRDLKLRVFAADHGTNDMANTGDDPTRKLIRQLFGALAEWQKSVIVHRCYAARMRLKAQGKPIGGNPKFGTRPGEREAIDRIQQLYINEKLSLLKVAERLNAEGVKSRSGRPWNDNSVLRVLESTTTVRKAETPDEDEYVLRAEQIKRWLVKYNPHTFREPKIP